MNSVNSSLVNLRIKSGVLKSSFKRISGSSLCYSSMPYNKIFSNTYYKHESILLVILLFLSINRNNLKNKRKKKYVISNDANLSSSNLLLNRGCQSPVSSPRYGGRRCGTICFKQAINLTSLLQLFIMRDNCSNLN